MGGGGGSDVVTSVFEVGDTVAGFCACTGVTLICAGTGVSLFCAATDDTPFCAGTCVSLFT
jgi:hypothetical protein